MNRSPRAPFQESVLVHSTVNFSLHNAFVNTALNNKHFNVFFGGNNIRRDLLNSSIGAGTAPGGCELETWRGMKLLHGLDLSSQEDPACPEKDPVLGKYFSSSLATSMVYHNGSPPSNFL